MAQLSRCLLRSQDGPDWVVRLPERVLPVPNRKRVSRKEDSAGPSGAP